MESIAQQAQSLLSSIPYTQIRKLECTVENGRLKVSGRLANFHMLQIVQTTLGEMTHGWLNKIQVG